MIKKIEFPDTIDYGMQYSDHWIMAEALNRIIDGLNDMDERIKEIQRSNKCECLEMTKAHYKNSLDDCPIGSSWFCPQHGRQELL